MGTEYFIIGFFVWLVFIAIANQIDKILNGDNEGKDE